MSTLHKTGIVLVVLCAAVMILPSTAAAIEGPDNWGSPEFNYTSNGNFDPNPGVLEAGFINKTSENLLFRINFTDSATPDLLSDNRTQIYIDSDTSSETGLNSTTYTDGGDAEEFYNNTDDIGADHRVSVGSGTNVVTPWDTLSQDFDSAQSDPVEVDERSESVVIEVPRLEIGEPDEIDVKFVYIDDPIKGDPLDDDYTWAPDPVDESINSSRFSLVDGESVPRATIDTTVSVGDDNIASGEDSAVEISVTNDNEVVEDSVTVEGGDSSDITESLSVDARNFEGGTGSVEVELTNGENYTFGSGSGELPVTTTDTNITGALSEDETKSIQFDTHELINISGTIGVAGGISDDDIDGEVTIDVEEDTNNNQLGETETITISDSSDVSYNRYYNASNFTSDGGTVVAALDADPYALNRTSADFTVSTPGADDVTKDFKIELPDQQFNLVRNISDNSVDQEAFNVTVSLDSNGNENISTVDHFVTYTSDVVTPTKVEVLDPAVGGNTTDNSSLGGGEDNLFIQDVSNNPVVNESSSAELYNITFKYVDGGVPDQGSENAQTVNIETGDDTEIYNDSESLQAESDPVTFDAVNDTTDLEVTSVNHLTAGGDMVGAPTRFDVEVTSNGGTIDNITLYNNRTNTEAAIKECDGSDCSTDGGEFYAVPTKSTYQGNISYTAPSDRFNITVYPEGAGSAVTINEPRVTGEIYNKSDVRGTPGSLSVLGVDLVINSRGSEAAGTYQWNNVNRNLARQDVNNDGVIDINDITQVANDYASIS